MCTFFSFISNGKGKYLYFDWEIRKRILSGELKLEHDSHTSIAHHFKVNEDKFNKYEYIPLEGKFIVDQINAKRDDQKSAEKWVEGLDLNEIVPALIVKPIFHPLKMRARRKVNKKDIKRLEEWASVRASAGDSVGASVRDSVWGYITSFYSIDQWKYIKHNKGGNPFKPLIDLWESGLVPSFDGKTWRLHGGEKGKILHEWVE